MKKEPKTSPPKRLVRKRSDGAIIAISLIALIAGPALGIALAITFAPSSTLALFIGFFLLPCTHLAGRFAWAVMGFVVDANSEGRRAIRALADLGKWTNKHRVAREDPDHHAYEGRFPRGGLVFILVHVLLSLAVGLLVGLLLSDTALTTVAGVYTLTGTLYGVVVYWLAENGYLLMRTESVTQIDS
jgi:hypothetical protein